MKIQKISVIIAAYNEEETIEEIIRRVRAVKLPNIETEIVVVDDGSLDRTRAILKNLSGIRVFFHEKNLGKGGALRTGINQSSGDVIILQDADLEYSPEDFPLLIQPILDDQADLVLGSRFLKMKGPHFFTKNGDPFFSHYIGNKMIIALTNFLYAQKVSDYEGCYKAFTKQLAHKVAVTANGFEFDNELICKSIRLNCVITEVPIQYHPRLYAEGKKIRWQDGMRMLWSIIKWRFLPVP